MRLVDVFRARYEVTMHPWEHEVPLDIGEHDLGRGWRIVHVERLRPGLLIAVCQRPVGFWRRVALWWRQWRQAPEATALEDAPSQP